MSFPDTKRVLVVGAAGGVGRLICKEVMRLLKPGSLVVGDYKIGRAERFAKSLGKDVAFCHVDVRNQKSIDSAIENVHAVIVATLQKEPLIQIECLSHQIPCLDITIHQEFISKVNELDSQAKSKDTGLLLMAGLFPGLSGIIVKSAAEKMSSISSIDVGLLQNTKASVGASGLADMLRMFNQTANLNMGSEKQQVPGFSAKKVMTFPEPFGDKKMRRVSFIEEKIVSKKLKVSEVNFWTAFEKESFNLLVSALNKTGAFKIFDQKNKGLKLAKIVNFLKKAGVSKTETAGVMAIVSGQKDGQPYTSQITAMVPSDYGTTAMCAAAMTRLILDGNVVVKGVKYPFEVFSLDQLLDTIDCEDINLYSRHVA